MTGEFEKWAMDKKYGSGDLEKCDEGSPRAGEYRNLDVQEDWETWQAARKTPIESIKMINNVIFAAGAPLGSENYFKIRGLCCDILYPKAKT